MKQDTLPDLCDNLIIFLYSYSPCHHGCPGEESFPEGKQTACMSVMVLCV